MEQIEAAILRTVLYADVFNFPLTVEEIHHFLIHDETVNIEEIRRTVDTSQRLKKTLEYVQGYVLRAGRRELLAIRAEREKASDRLWSLARIYGVWMARLPFVRMVAVTGALAVRNVSDTDDDLDFLIVTAPGRVWLARAFAILLVRLARLRGVDICPNYVLAENKLEQSRQDLFTAHEIAQMAPVYGYELYRRMREANAWSEDYLPNAIGIYRPEAERSVGRVWGAVKSLVEIVLGGRFGNALEAWEYRRKLRRFQPALNDPNSSAQIDADQVKGHFNDNGHPTLQQYRARLRQYGLDEVTVSVPGD